MKIVKPSFKLIVIALACFVSLGFIGTKVIGFINPAVADLDMNGYNILMKTGLIGYNGTAAKGLSFDAGNEKVVLESGQIILPVGSAALPSLIIGSEMNTGFYKGSTGQWYWTSTGNHKWQLGGNYFGSTGDGGKFRTVIPSATVPAIILGSDIDTGIGCAAADQLSLISNGVEGMRVQAGRDDDLDNTDVYVTGLTSGYGTFQVTCDGNFAEFYLENTTITKAYGNALFTITKDNAATYNVYWDTTEFKIQNLVGDNKVMVWSYRGLVP